VHETDMTRPINILGTIQKMELTAPFGPFVDKLVGGEVEEEMGAFVCGAVGRFDLLVAKYIEVGGDGVGGVVGGSTDNVVAPKTIFLLAMEMKYYLADVVFGTL